MDNFEYWREDGWGLRLREPTLDGHRKRMYAFVDVLQRSDDGEIIVYPVGEIQPLNPRMVAGALSAVDPSGSMHIDLMRFATEVRGKILSGESTDPDNDPLQLIMSHSDLIVQDIPPRYFLGGFIAERTISMVFAARGRGKTRFSMGLASAIAAGDPYLSWDSPEGPSGVLYVDGEMPTLLLKDIAKKMNPDGLNNLWFLPSEYVYAKTDKELRLTTEGGRNLVDDIIKAKSDIKFLVLDNISCLFPGIREDKKEDWEPVAAWLVRLRHRGISTLLVHHSGKSGDQRGSSGREDALDNIVKLKAPPNYSPEDGCHFHLEFGKNRSLVGDMVKTIDVRCVEDDERIRFVWTPVENSLLEQARELIMNGLTRVTDIADELNVSKGYASKLKKQVEEGN